jgi:hypothetical protein
MSIPVAPGRLPLVGHLVQLLARPLQFLSSLCHVGELVRVDLGSAPMITARWDLHPTLDRPVRPVPCRAALTPGALPMRVRARAHGP